MAPKNNALTSLIKQKLDLSDNLEEMAIEVIKVPLPPPNETGRESSGADPHQSQLQLKAAVQG